MSAETVESIVGDDLITLSKVKSYIKIIDGKIVHVKEYENKVQKKVIIDLHGEHPSAIAISVPYGHIELNKLKIHPKIKVHQTQSGNVIITHPVTGQAVTLKYGGEIVPTAAAMKAKVEAGDLSVVTGLKTFDKPTTVTTSWGKKIDVPANGVAIEKGNYVYLYSPGLTTYHVSYKSGTEYEYPFPGYSEVTDAQAFYNWTGTYGTVLLPAEEIDKDLPEDLKMPTAVEAESTKEAVNYPNTFQVPGHGKVVLSAKQTLYQTPNGNYLLYTEGGTPVLMHKTGATGKPAQSYVDMIGELPIVAKGTGTGKAAPAASSKDEKPGDFASTKDVQAYIAQVKAQLKASLSPEGYNNPNGIPYSTFNSMTVKEHAALLADPSLIKLLETAVGKLQPVAKWKSSEDFNPSSGQITKADKQQVGKERSRLESVLRMSKFAVALLHDTDLSDEQINTELAFLQDKASYKKVTVVFGKSYAFDVLSAANRLRTMTQVYKYDKTTKELGFDPQTADVYVLSDFAKSVGYNYAAGLSSDELREWVRLHLGDPELGSTEQNAAKLKKLSDKGAKEIVKAGIVSQAEKALKAAAKKSSNKDVPEQAVAQDSAAKLAKFGMVSLYVQPESLLNLGDVAVFADGHIEWGGETVKVWDLPLGTKVNLPSQSSEPYTYTEDPNGTTGFENTETGEWVSPPAFDSWIESAAADGDAVTVSLPDDLQQKAQKYIKHVDGPAHPWEMHYFTDEFDSHHVAEDFDPVSVMDDDQMLDLLSKGGWEPAPDAVKVYGPPGADYVNKNKAFEATAGSISDMSPAALNLFIKNNGGNYVGKMDTETKREWIRWHLIGDPIAEWTIEAENAAKSNVGAGTVHKDIDTHPGSSASPLGKATRQNLVDMLAQTEWGTTLLGWTSNGTTTSQILTAASGKKFDVEAAYSALHLHGLSPAWYGPADEVSQMAKSKAVMTWVKRHKDLGTYTSPSAGVVLDKKFDVTDYKVEPITIDKPPDVSDDDWKFVNAVEALKGEPELLKDFSSDYGTMSEKEIDTLINNDYYIKNGSAGFYAPDAIQAPLNIKRLLMFARNNPAESKGLSEAIRAKVAGGAYKNFDKGQANFVVPSTNTNIWLKPGDGVFQLYNSFLIMSADGSSVAYNSAGAKTDLVGVTPADLKKNGWKLIAHGGYVPKTVSFDEIHALYPVVNKYDWATVEQYETKSPDDVTLPGVDESLGDDELTQIIKKSAVWGDGGIPLPSDSALATIPLQVKKLLAWSCLNADSVGDYSIIVGAKADAGYYAAKFKTVTPPSVDDSKSWGYWVNAGYTAPNQITGYWPASAVAQYAADHGLVLGNSVASSTAATIIAESIAGGAHKTEPTPKDADTSSSSEIILTKNPNAKKLGGMHSKVQWLDQHGGEWMSKAFGSDPNAKLRIDSEHAANLIGRVFGTGAPETRSMNVEGKYAYVQRLVPAKGSIRNIPLSSLTDDVLFQAASEHVLDWMISNHDTHPDNLLLSPDGKRVIPIDKGQAFKFFPSDVLAVDYLPPGNGEKVWYDQWYHAIMDGQIPKERADKIVARILAKAKQSETKQDKRFRELLETAFASKKEFPPKYPNKEAYINALMERKHGLFDDFEALYKGVYAKAGWKWDIDITPLLKAKLFDEAHADVTPGLIEDVSKAKTHGKSLMFNSTDLEEAHLLIYTEKAADGTTNLAADGKLRQDADKTLYGWLLAQDVQTLNGASLSAAPQPVNTGAVLPNNDTWIANIVAAAKTVNTHASDGSYNASTMSALASVTNTIKNQLAQAETDSTFKKVMPDGKISISGVGVFVDSDQLKAFADMCTTYLKYIEEIQAAKNGGTKTASKSYAKYVYTPKPKAEVAEEYTTSDHPYTLQKLEDGTWKQVVSSTGESYDITPEEASEKIDKDGLSLSESVEVSAGSKTIKVTKRQSTNTVGNFDPKTHMMTHSGQDTTSGASGWVFDIEFDDTKIEYRPWSETNHVSQQGILRIRIKNHVSNEAPLQEALDVLRTAGVDLAPADEDGLELLYWRMVSANVAEYSDGQAGKYAAVAKEIKDCEQLRKTGSLDPSEELSRLKAAWAKAIGQSKVDTADWQPHFSHYSIEFPEETTGRPFWNRPDVSLSDLHGYWGDTSLHMSITNNAAKMGDYLPSGGMMATEERLRALGKWLSTGSPDADQGTGGASYLFTRQKVTSSFGSHGGASVYLMPHVGLRFNNMPMSHDVFGNIKERKNHYYSPEKAFGYTSGGNETDVKTSASFLDDVAAMIFPSEAARQTAIKHMKDAGITELHGVPVEQCYVTDLSAAKAILKKIWQWDLAQVAK